jgi:hypothetical protein
MSIRDKTEGSGRPFTERTACTLYTVFSSRSEKVVEKGRSKTAHVRAMNRHQRKVDRKGKSRFHAWRAMLLASALGGLAASPRTPNQATALFTRLFTDADATAEAYEAHGVNTVSPEAQDPMDHSSCSSSLKHCPNIMMLLSDDHGYTDLGKDIDPNVDTPNLDRMVREGMRFTSGYSSAPQCVPSRAGLMSGRDQNRFGLFQNGADAGYGEDTLPPNVKTIAEHVRQLGYVTGMAGKWHLGSNHDNKTNPGGRGFHEYMSGTMGNFYTNVDRSTGDVIHGAPVFDDAGTGKSSHVPNELDSLKGLPKLNTDYRNRVDATGDFAEAFITRHAQNPFFFVSEGRLEPPPRTASRAAPGSA